MDTRREALRQQMLLRALWRDTRPGHVEGWLRDGPERRLRGLQAYQANAAALAERALAAAYPTLQQLLGAESFASLARAFWHAVPPRCGDIAQWGAELPAFVGRAAQLAPEAYLADVARLEWALHEAASATDDGAPVQGLERLAVQDPQRLRLRLRAGSALLRSPYPIVALWQAHRSDDAGRFAPVRAAFAAGRGESALVWRQGYRTHVAALDAPAADFTGAVLAGATLSQALCAAGEPFDFQAWLLAAVREGRLAAVQAA